MFKISEVTRIERRRRREKCQKLWSLLFASNAQEQRTHFAWTTNSRVNNPGVTESYKTDEDTTEM